MSESPLRRIASPVAISPRPSAIGIQRASPVNGRLPCRTVATRRSGFLAVAASAAFALRTPLACLFVFAGADALAERTPLFPAPWLLPAAAWLFAAAACAAAEAATFAWAGDTLLVSEVETEGVAQAAAPPCAFSA